MFKIIFMLIMLIMSSGCVDKKAVLNTAVGAYGVYSEVQNLREEVVETAIEGVVEAVIVAPEPERASDLLFSEELTETVEVVGDQEIIDNLDYSTLLTKYMTPEGIMEAPATMNIISDNHEDIYCDTGEVYDRVGHFPIAITSDSKAYHGGHGHKGGATPPITRNTGLSGRHARDYGIPVDKIRGYFLIQGDFEGRNKKVYKRSQIKWVL